MKEGDWIVFAIGTMHSAFGRIAPRKSGPPSLQYVTVDVVGKVPRSTVLAVVPNGGVARNLSEQFNALREERQRRRDAVDQEIMEQRRTLLAPYQETKEC